ncbi:TPA: hypothetical protein I8273_004631 [Aeromonas hydrophila]|nr:hypothetical protein [Aeromonas hydrophila]HAT2639093.1 hypothetical protein [Aeromonas hydrophila]HAT3424257.1 hypothetical protein [Aeromonas hydrophila]HAT3534255.1 hypothetical protein [Aeromonas hydrophila]
MVDPITAKARMQAKGLHTQGFDEAGKVMLDMATEYEAMKAKHVMLAERLSSLLEVAEGYQEWIKAVPNDVAASLPTMPGIDGDWASEVIYEAKTALR